QSTSAKSVKEAFVPTVYASGATEKQKEGAKQVIGTEIAVITAADLPTGVATAAVMGGGGAAAEGIGKVSGNKDLQNCGKVAKNAPAQPLKEVKKAFE
ncbi:24722_t:CDS:1, partial [Gigaspora margarita]